MWRVGPGKSRSGKYSLFDFLTIYLRNMKALSEREWLALHAEIKAMQELFGLSYKDSAHHLYLAEISRLKTLDTAHKSFRVIRERIDKVVDHELLPPMQQLEDGE